MAARTPPAAVLFDRDGTLVVDVPYNGDPARVEPMPDALDAVAAVRAAGIPTAVVSNQSGIARGLITRADVDAYAAAADSDGRSLGSLLGEWTAVRRATLALFRHLGPEALARRVVANGAPMSARAAAWIIAGHELHHRAILRDRYT